MPSTYTYIIYIMLGIFVLYIYSFGGQRCAVHALHAAECPHCTPTESTYRRHWPLLLIVQWQMHTDRAGIIYVYNPGHIVTGNSGEYNYVFVAQWHLSLD